MRGTSWGWTLGVVLCGGCFDEPPSSTSTSDGSTGVTPGATTDGETTDAPTDATGPTEGTICPEPLADCDEDPVNGCEADLDVDPENCGECGERCGPLAVCEGAQCVPGCAGGIVYVSPDGDDEAFGCDPDAPKQTIGAALEVARELGVPEVHVCAGPYPESPTVRGAVTLLGGFSCGTWQRVADYGFPGFDTSDASFILGDGSSGPALVVEGEETQPGSVVDGFFVIGQMSDTESQGILVRDRAAPTLSNNWVAGGPAGVLAVAIDIADGGAPVVEANFIFGRDPDSDADGATVGVRLQPGAGRARVVGNAIDAGAGGEAAASVGISVDAAVALDEEFAIARNLIDAGTGTAAPGLLAVGTIGVFATAQVQSLTLVDNIIDGGEASCPGACNMFGVLSQATGAVTLVRNRVYGGVGPAAATIAAIRVDGAAGPVLLRNNFVHSGSAAGVAASTTGIEVVDSPDVHVDHNTIVSGPGAMPSGESYGIRVRAPDVRILSNFFLGTGVRDGGLFVDACLVGGGSILQLSANAFANHGVNFGTIASQDGGCTEDSPAEYSEFIGVLNALQSSALPVDGATVIFDDICAVGANCAPLDGCGGTGPGNDCALEFFQAFHMESNGAGNLAADEPGWQIRNGAPCQVTEGAPATPVENDGYGNVRTEPEFTIGAEEFDGSCTEL